MEETVSTIKSLKPGKFLAKRPKLYARIGRTYPSKNPLDSFKLIARVSDKN